jgi:hypothetical protein
MNERVTFVAAMLEARATKVMFLISQRRNAVRPVKVVSQRTPAR